MRKNILDLFVSVVSQFQKCHPSGNPKFNNLGIFQCLKFRILIKRNLPISLRLNFTPNSLGGCELREKNIKSNQVSIYDGEKKTGAICRLIVFSGGSASYKEEKKTKEEQEKKTEQKKRKNTTTRRFTENCPSRGNQA